MAVEGVVLWILILLGTSSALVWSIMHGIGTISILRVRELPDAATTGESLPSLSVILTAANEEESLEFAVRSLLKQVYQKLEIVLVDDRSGDATGQIIDRIAAENSKVTAVHIQELPSGWLGKVNAMRNGMLHSSGEYVLFADADVWFSPGVLTDAMDLMVREDFDHMTLLPRLRGTSLMQCVLMQEFYVGYIRRTKGHRNFEKTRTYFGFGAFNLVRRSAFESTEGFEWFRMDVLDDLALGALMKRKGFRSWFGVAPQGLEILWYPDLSSALKGFGKNAFGGLAGYSYPALFGFALGMPIFIFGPLLLLLQTQHPFLWILSGIAFLSLILEALAARFRFGMPVIHGLLTPMPQFLMTYAMLRSGLLCWHQGGIHWKGTFYPVEELRAGRRVSFP